MNYSKFFAGVAFCAASLSFPACSDNGDGPDVPDTPAQPTTYFVALTMSGTDFDLGDGNTLARTFKDADKAGLFVIKDGEIVVENAELTYDGACWVTYEDLTGTDGRFMVYYPYSATASNKVNTSADNADDFFASYIASVGAPSADQSNLSGVMHYDVLYGQAAAVRSRATGPKIENLLLNVTVSHSLAATSLALPGGTTYKTADGFAYSTPGAATVSAVKLGNNAVTPASVNGRPTVFYQAVSDPQLTVEYTLNGDKKTATVTLEGTAGTVNTVDIDGGSPDGGTRDLQVGDLYYRDGSIYPVELLSEVSHAPTGVAGVIFCVDPARFSAEETALLGNVHALVVSAKMARTSKNATYMVWCQTPVNVPADDEGGRFDDSKEDPNHPGLFLPVDEGRTDFASAFNIDNADLRGYYYTSVIRGRRADEISKGYYPPFEALNNLAKSVPVSETATTGWYLPSIGQMLDILRNLGGAKATIDNAQHFESYTDSDYIFAPESSENLSANLDASISKIMFTERDSYVTADYAIWTSTYTKIYSIYTYTFVPSVREAVFDSDILSIMDYDIIGRGNVRGVLAF